MAAGSPAGLLGEGRQGGSGRGAGAGGRGERRRGRREGGGGGGEDFVPEVSRVFLLPGFGFGRRFKREGGLGERGEIGAEMEIWELGTFGSG